MTSTKDGSMHIQDIHRIFSDFIVGEILLALEENGILGMIATGNPFSIQTVARGAGINENKLRAACDFLSEQELCEKLSADRYRLIGAYDDIKSSVDFFLAYKPAYESLAGLLNGSTRYGSDIMRNGIYYRRALDAIVAHSFPFLLIRFNELGVKRVTGIGANALGFLRVALNELRPDACVGVVSDEERVELEDERSARSRSFEDIRIVQGELEHPEQFSVEAPAEALVSVAVFHDFRPEDRLRAVLGEYKRAFPSSRMFLLEFDVQDQDGMRGGGASPARHLASVSRLTHALKEEIRPWPMSEWTRAIGRSPWRLAQAKKFESGLVIYECE